MFGNEWVQKVANRIDPKFFGRALAEVPFDDDCFESIMDCADYVAPQPVKVKNMSHDVMTVDDLPIVGDEEVTYKVTSTLDLYRWTGKEYIPFNPYTDLTVQKVDDRAVIVDPSSAMPFISEDSLNAGKGDLRLAMVYNIHALREDLRRLKEKDIGLDSLLPKNMRVSNMDTNSLWLATNHASLVKQLRQVVKGKNKYNTYVVEGLNRLGVDVWYDTHKKRIGFKDDAFVALV